MPPVENDSSLLLDVAVAFAVALAGGWLATRLRLPAIVGYIAAGLVISPFTPGFVGDADRLRLIADVGIVLLLFSVGIQFTIADLFRGGTRILLVTIVATLGTAALLSSVIGAILGGGVQAGASAVGNAASAAVSGATGAASQAEPGQAGQAGQAEGPMGYFVDSLFRAAAGEDRRDDRQPEQSAAAVAEVSRIFANGIRAGSLPNDDVGYVGQVVAQRTDLSQQQAEQRVRDVFMNLQNTLNDAETKARQAADDAREASAYAALWLFISLLAGAFIASWMATFGGKQRDL